MSEIHVLPVEYLAVEFALLYRRKCALKTERHYFQCLDAESGGDVSDDFAPGVPPCWKNPDGEQCAECQKRAAVHAQVVKITSELTNVRRKLFRAIDWEAVQ